MKNNLHRIVVKGGVLSLGDLREIISVAEDLGLHEISFGSRQDVVIPQDGLQNINEELFKNLTVVHPSELGKENIVSSYVSSDIFPNTLWLTGNKYLYILETFRYQPNLKINITDPKQRLVPLFTGNLNFIASADEDYWYLYVKLPQWKESQLYPVLVYSWDIAKVSYQIEQLLQEEPDSIEMLFELVSEHVSDNNRTIQICHRTVGKAIVNASLTIVFGFSILILSNFIPSIYFGIFTGLAMLTAMTLVLTLMPQLISIIKPFKNG